jgi:hypothetical protein
MKMSIMKITISRPKKKLLHLHLFSMLIHIQKPVSDSSNAPKKSHTYQTTNKNAIPKNVPTYQTLKVVPQNVPEQNNNPMQTIPSLI